MMRQHRRTKADSRRSTRFGWGKRNWALHHLVATIQNVQLCYFWSVCVDLQIPEEEGGRRRAMPRPTRGSEISLIIDVNKNIWLPAMTAHKFDHWQEIYLVAHWLRWASRPCRPQCTKDCWIKVFIYLQCGRRPKGEYYRDKDLCQLNQACQSLEER